MSYTDIFALSFAQIASLSGGSEYETFMPVLEVFKQNASGNSACVKPKDGAIYYSFRQKEQFLTCIQNEKKKKTTVGDNHGYFCKDAEFWIYTSKFSKSCAEF